MRGRHAALDSVASRDKIDVALGGARCHVKRVDGDAIAATRQAVANASVGDMRAARHAGYNPAMQPTSSVTVRPPIDAHAGTTAGHPSYVAKMPVTRMPRTTP